ncbi:MAG TPA: ATP-binding protein [Steroidobacteraceae bacterium]|nr:ATP-binding protein [Steroidobacteraceae bacterium]
MKLRTRLNLVVAGLTATFVAVLIAAEIVDARSSVREEIEAANRVAAHLLGRIAAINSNEGGTQVVLGFLQQLGRVRANEVILRTDAGVELYRSPPSPYKAGRSAPQWFTRMLAPQFPRHVFPLPGGVQLVVEANASRAILDGWDDLQTLFSFGAVMLLIVNGLAFWLVSRALAPFPAIAAGLQRIQAGELDFRLPPLGGAEASAMGLAFNGMAQAVEDKVRAERKARDAEIRLEEGRERARLIEQHVEEERRLIAHELHDEFGQSVTAIRALALAISAQAGDARQVEVAQLISTEAGRLYDAMHGLIPRLMPLSLDTLGLADTLESLLRQWQGRYPGVELSLEQELPDTLGPSVTLVIYRVVQEALINALRHAQARAIGVVVKADASSVCITVTDDGVGLAPGWNQPGHFGLRGLASRVEGLGGAFAVTDREPKGVRLSVDIPLGAGP